jgi:hypothetical protein
MIKVTLEKMSVPPALADTMLIKNNTVVLMARAMNNLMASCMPV